MIGYFSVSATKQHFVFFHVLWCVGYECAANILKASFLFLGIVYKKPAQLYAYSVEWEEYVEVQSKNLGKVFILIHWKGQPKHFPGQTKNRNI